jgi:hypothetical protein
MSIPKQIFIIELPDEPEVSWIQAMAIPQDCTHIHIDCAQADISLPDALTCLVSRIRKLMREGKHIKLLNPPQLLVHNLYRTGFYPHPQIECKEIREDEGSSS